MVDELELLKRDWKKQEASLPRVTAEEIYPMLHKKSSSIVKWIFIISSLEFVFWMILSFFLKGPNYGDLKIESRGLQLFESIFLVIHASVLLFFVIKFYLNFREIKSTDSASLLMNNILRTRKTVKHFILANLILFVIAAIVTTKFVIDLNAETFNFTNGTLLIVLLALSLVVFLLILWFLYNKVYGLFLRRLNRNYEELKKMEV